MKIRIVPLEVRKLTDPATWKWPYGMSIIAATDTVTDADLLAALAEQYPNTEWRVSKGTATQPLIPIGKD